MFDPDQIPSSACRAVTTGLCAAAVAILPAGCQTYSPNPPDLTAHHELWEERGRNHPEVAAFAETLRQTGVAVASPDADEPCTLKQAEMISLVFNPDLRLARSRAGVTKAASEFADLWDDPVLEAGLERVLASVDHPWEGAGSINFTLPISGRLEYEKARADAAHHAELYRVLDKEWQIRSELRRAWIEWSAVREKVHVTSSFLDRLEDIAEIVRRMEEVGELARVQAALFSIELHTRRNESRSIEAQVRDRELLLCRLMGLPPNIVAEGAAFEPRVVVDSPATSSEDAARRIREQHPRLQAKRAKHTTAERSLALQIRRQYPDLTFGPGYGYEDGHNKLLVGFSLPIGLFNRNRAGIAEATAQREHARAELETAYERLLGELAAARNKLEAAEDQLSRMRETIIPLVDQQYDDARHVAELGEVDTLLLLDTLRRQYEAKIDLIDLEARRSIAAIRLRELLGPSEDEQRSMPHLLRSEDSEQPP